MKRKEIIVTASDGYKLTATIKEPESQAIKGVVQIQCCAGLKQSFYSNFATYLSENGYVTITFDYRGIGKSKPKTLKGFDASLT
jgi:predicted alpha/beta hydrolase